LSAGSLDDSLGLIHQLDSQMNLRALMALISPHADH
jgi:hypothetical protein